MTNSRIHIIHKFQNGPFGGSNQFAKMLKTFLQNEDRYTEDPAEANVLLFLSYAELKTVIALKNEFPDKTIIHRLDGPVQLHSGIKSRIKDQIIFWANKHLANATIFQSEWSHRENRRLGLPRNSREIVIRNAAASDIFNTQDKTEFSNTGKTKVIITSWSTNMAKGYPVYQWLDQNLDFNKYQLTFVGRSPVEFKNIRQVAPLSSSQLAEELKKHDIYLTASEKDACSNALIEALSCGLPAIARNDGGHPELVKNGGELFNSVEEIPDLLRKIAYSYSIYQSNISIPSQKEVGHQYLNFIDTLEMMDKPARISPWSILQLRWLNLIRRLSSL